MTRLLELIERNHWRIKGPGNRKTVAIYEIAEMSALDEKSNSVRQLIIREFDPEAA